MPARRTPLWRHVLITGGSAGIGLAMAREALRSGAAVTLVARTQSKLDEAKRGLEAGVLEGEERRVGVQAADVTDAKQARLRRCNPPRPSRPLALLLPGQAWRAGDLVYLSCVWQPCSGLA
jgi:hypothetical protein